VADLTTGAAIAGYRIEAVLGHGSMGTVYSALDTGLDRRVALKVLTPELYRDERFRERFLRESKLAASLEHPHIVPIYAAGEADGSLYLAMRYIEGRDLSALLKSLGRLDPERVLAIVRQVASALDVAHARGLVHRDVKPANILVTRHGGEGEDYAYLCDFGLAKHASTVSSLTGSRAIVGTVDYLAPEQIEGKPVDGRVDVYALGCVLYECLTGVPPFERGNELAALLAHVNDPPPVLSERRAELPEALDGVLVTALAKDRDLRYGTCAELVEAVVAALSGETPAAPAPPRVTTEAVRTFLFADIRGYTAYTRQQGDEAGAALARQFAAIVVKLAPKHAGALQELRGDEALVVFDSPRQALRFALALQAQVGEAELPRPVGIGLDAGEAIPVEDGFRGGALNRAARLCALAKPGEVLASDAVRELAGAAGGVAYGFRRVERLKGFDKPVGVVEIHPAERAPKRELTRSVKRTLGGPRPRRRLLIAAALIAAAVAAVVPLAFLSGGEPAEASVLREGTVGLVDAKTMKPVATMDEVGVPDSVWRDPQGLIWSLDAASGSMTKIDPKTRKVLLRFPLQVDPGWPAWGAGSFWMGDYSHATVVRYDPQYGTIVKRIQLPTKGLDNPDITSGLTFGAGSVWAAYGKWPFRIARIDLATNKVVKTIDLPKNHGQALLYFANGSLWVVSQDTGQLWRVNPRTSGVVATAKLHGGWVEDLRVVGGDAWVPIENDRAVWKVDPNGNILKSITTGDLPYALSDDGTNLFVVNNKGASLSRIDTATDGVTTVHVGHRPQGIAVGAGLLWVPLAESVSDATAGLTGEKILHVSTEGDPLFNTDPALTTSAPQMQLQQAVGARLLRYPDKEQPDGATLVPEIADLPVVSNGGRTYTFHIRRGYRFSPPSGAPVTAGVMRYSIERALSPEITDPTAQGYNMLQDIVGYDAYRAGKAEHLSGIRVGGDRLSFTLKKAAADFPARISLPLFSAVPLGTPALPHGVPQPIPSAGPYYVSAHVGDLAEVIKRNPNYGGSRPHRFDAFVVENGVDAGVGAQRVMNGLGDYAFAEQPPYPDDLQPRSQFARRYGVGSAAAKAGRQRYFNPPFSGVQLVIFNAQSKALADPAVRRAINLALDRKRVATLTASDPYASLIPLGIPGADRSALYPLDGPDVKQALRLMRGRHLDLVYLNGTPDGCERCAEVADTVKQNLAAIGINLNVRVVDDRFGEATQSKNWDLVEFTWFLDFVDPGDFTNVLFDPKHPLGYGYPVPLPTGLDEPWGTRLRAAHEIGGSDRGATYRRLVAGLLRSAPPAAPYGTQNGPAQVFSSRVGCQVFRPQDWGYVDLAALCLRGKS
jgi:class 3 adenylate cyclase/ABC-type transport system substrate-binding protein/tRNA A-37 threonylcarbamoyl transferase component Bud32/streptogramin lyase